jgi:hypothetical protein
MDADADWMDELEGHSSAASDADHWVAVYRLLVRDLKAVSQSAAPDHLPIYARHLSRCETRLAHWTRLAKGKASTPSAR